MKIFTIGVYNSTEDEFFNKLVTNNVDTFCDIRQRRGVRGKTYSFVNSKYLQEKLKSLNIKYIHILDLAPTKDIREKQWAKDKELGETKRSRDCLGDVFIKEYEKNILNDFDFNNLVDRLKNENAQNVVFFCVEHNAAACHRSLVAEKLNEKYNYPIKHL